MKPTRTSCVIPCAWHYLKDRLAYEMGSEILLCNYWPTETLLACISMESPNHHTALRYAESGCQHSRSDCFIGVKGLLHAILGRPAVEYSPRDRDMEHAQWAAGLFRDMEINPDFFGPVNMALVSMGFGRYEEAIEHLAKACDDHDPLMVWLHLWPIFDPLREEEGFKALIQRMNLPASAVASAATLRSGGSLACRRKGGDTAPRYCVEGRRAR